MPKAAVLIIDDSVTIRAAMEHLLHNDPRFDVAGIACNVDEARKLMRTVSHDIVTLDLSMPGTGGLDFLDELSGRTHAPIVVVSSSTKYGSLEEEVALGRGAFSCFDKAKLLSDAAGFFRVLLKASSAKRP